MVQKTIPQLNPVALIDGNALVPVDTGIQSFKITAQNLADSLAVLAKLSDKIKKQSALMGAANWNISDLPATTGYLGTITSGLDQYGTTIFVILNSDSTGAISCLTSPNGITWTTRTTTKLSWRSVRYHNGLFVAVAQLVTSGIGSIITSPDGVTWTLRATPINRTYVDVTWGNGKWVAIEAGDSSSTDLLTSPDGINWTQSSTGISLSPTKAWSSICYGNGLFVIANAGSADAGAPFVATSPDGVTWTKRTTTTNGQVRRVVFGNGRFVACTYGSRIWYSDDAINWTLSPFIVDVDPRGLCYGGGVYVIGGAGFGVESSIYVSPDGVSWRRVIVPFNQATPAWSDITYGNGVFMTLNGTKAIRSLDPCLI